MKKTAATTTAALLATTSIFGILLINTAFSVSLSLTISGEVGEEETPAVETVNVGGGVIMISHTSTKPSTKPSTEPTPTPTKQVIDIIIDAVTTPDESTSPQESQVADPQTPASQKAESQAEEPRAESQPQESQPQNSQLPESPASSAQSPAITNLPQESDFQFVQQVIPERTKEEIKFPDISVISKPQETTQEAAQENQPTQSEIIETSENEKFSIEGQIESKQGHVLLEIINVKTGEPKIIQIESSDEGAWNYNPAYKLPDGDYKAFVWFFSQDGNEKSNLVNSFSFSVKEKAEAKESMKASTVSIVTENGMAKFKIKLKENSFSEAWTDSVFYKILQGKNPERKLFYINGQILNADATLNTNDDLKLIFVVTPILKAELNNEELFGDIEYKIYNSKGELVRSITDENEYLFSNNIMAFYKELPLSASLASNENYNLVVSMKTKEIEYETQFNFIVAAQESDKMEENRGIPIRDMALPGAIIFSILVVVLYFYKKN